MVSSGGSVLTLTLKYMQVRVEIQRAKLELLFELHRLPTEEEIIKKVGISPERYREVMKAAKPVVSLHLRHPTTQEEYINGITDVDGCGGDKWRQHALLRLALDDVVILSLLFFNGLLNFLTNCFFYSVSSKHETCFLNFPPFSHFCMSNDLHIRMRNLSLPLCWGIKPSKFCYYVLSAA